MQQVVFEYCPMRCNPANRGKLLLFQIWTKLMKLSLERDHDQSIAVDFFWIVWHRSIPSGHIARHENLGQFGLWIAWKTNIRPKRHVGSQLNRGHADDADGDRQFLKRSRY